MELKRNSRFKFVLYLEKLSTVIHKFEFKTATGFSSPQVVGI